MTFRFGIWLLGIGIASMPAWPEAVTRMGYSIAGIGAGLILASAFKSSDTPISGPEKPRGHAHEAPHNHKEIA